jgi:hypothetical protein
LAFALVYTNHHSLAVDIAAFQVNGFRDAQACRVAAGQDRPVLGVTYPVEELKDFLGAENYRQLLRSLGSRNQMLE